VRVAAPLAAFFLAAGALPAAAGGLVPASRPPLDPEISAQVVIRGPSSEPFVSDYARGGRFAGDLSGDGRDDVLLVSADGERLLLFFADEDWGDGSQDEPDGDGDTEIVLPEGCAGSDLGARAVAAGDLDGDGFDDLAVGCPGWTGLNASGEPLHGAVLIFLGRPLPWGGSLDEPDVWLFGEPEEWNGPAPVDGEQTGLALAGPGDLDGDGRGDLVVAGSDLLAEDQPLLWVFLGDADLGSAWEDGADSAAWTLRGSEDILCLDPLRPAGIGDVDGDGLLDFAALCGEQPSPVGPNPNELDIALSAWLGASISALAPGEISFSDRDFGWAAGVQRVPQAGAFMGLGELDGQPGEEFGVVAWFEAEGGLSANIVRGHPEPFADIDLLTPFSPFLLKDSYEGPEGLLLAPAGTVPGTDGVPGVWMRLGIGTEARVGLLLDVDPKSWESLDNPPLIATFSAPAGLEVDSEWRLGLGGPGDADGDGTFDLLITAGYADADGCTPEFCGGAFIVLCRDDDGDGVSPCAGDCDDGDATIAPGLPEQCDPVDQDCDGGDGQQDQDGDGVLGCEGDCDDLDPLRFPGAPETCEDAADLDCDGLAPPDDADGDGALNCEDCQPWVATVLPGAAETCDGLDTDCDGSLPVDEQDVDQDGWRACEEGGRAADCDDLDPLIHPFRFEDCGNGLDDDCDGLVDNDADADGDGVRSCEGDCDDGDATVFPGAGELCDGLDNDCDGRVDDGRDEDGDGIPVCGGDCDDRDPLTLPGRVGHCAADDSNCDGIPDVVDGDGDGWSACGGDCDDADPGVHPAAHEVCDRRDNDCSGGVDEPFDLDLDGWANCLGDCADGDADRHPQPVEPDCDDAIDGDCDGIGDSLDSDCPAPEPPPPAPPRPYGLSCADCGGNVAGRGGEAGLAPGLALAFFGLAVSRRRRCRESLAKVLENQALVRVPPGIAVGLLVLLLPVLALAARREPALVVYMSDQPDMKAMADSQAAVQGAGMEAREVLHSSELLEPAGEGLLAIGALSSRRCPEGGGPPAPGEAAETALDRLIELDYAGARRILDAAVDGLPCLDQAMPRRVFQQLLYYRGVVQFGLRDEAAAAKDFQSVLALQPDFAPDPNFPPQVNGLLEKLRGMQQGVKRQPLYVFAPPGNEVRVDGGVIDPQLGALDVYPGPHIVQVLRGRRTWTLQISVVEGDRPVILLGSDRVRALRDAAVDPAAREFAAQVLGWSLADLGLDLAALVDLDVAQQPLRYLYRPSSDAFDFEEAWLIKRGGGGGGGTAGGAQASSGRGGSAKGGGAAGGGSGALPSARGTAGTKARGAVAAGPQRPEPHVRIRISGGFLYVHRFPYVQIPLDIGIRAIEGLFVDMGIEAANPGPTAYGPVWLPSASVGLSWRFLSGAFQPRLGGLARFALDSADGSVGVRVGWAGRLGADVVAEGSPTFFGFDVQAGMLGKPFAASVAAGLGFRF
jgi:hypothetical protein